MRACQVLVLRRKRFVSRRSRRLLWLALALIACLTRSTTASAAGPLAELEEQAIRAAVQRVAPAVVRIETVGGLQRIGELLLGTGPTTGLVVSPDGWIVSSAVQLRSEAGFHPGHAGRRHAVAGPADRHRSQSGLGAAQGQSRTAARRCPRRCPRANCGPANGPSPLGGRSKPTSQTCRSALSAPWTGSGGGRFRQTPRFRLPTMAGRWSISPAECWACWSPWRPMPPARSPEWNGTIRESASPCRWITCSKCFPRGPQAKTCTPASWASTSRATILTRNRP